MNKKTKIVLGIVIGIIIAMILFVTDFIFILNYGRPLFAIKKDNKYIGLIYDTYICNEYSVPQVKLKGIKYSCSEVTINKYEIREIVDTTKSINDFVCAEALEQFYENNNYEYYYSCIKGKYIIVKYENGFEETVSDALKNSRIKISDLDTYEIEYIIKEKSGQTTTTVLNDNNSDDNDSNKDDNDNNKDDNSNLNKYEIENIIDEVEKNGLTCLQALEQFYEDDNYKYYFSCLKSDSVIVTYESGKTETVKSALENGRIKISDLDIYGIKYFKMEKTND